MEKKTNDNRTENLPIVFLSDQPITADKEQQMRFGHVSIAESLRNIILSCPTPFTVGFLGKWGTGKTTILDSLRARLISDGIGVVKFDVWKHEGDSLRRTFLKETIEQLKEEKCLSHSFKHDERLDESISRSVAGKFRLKWPGIILLASIIVLFAIIGLVIWKFSPALLGTYISILSGGLITAFIVLLLQQTVTAEKVTTSTDKYKDPYQFESEFKKVINNLKSNKLVVIVDNLDRTLHEKAVELLSTIKTYLDQDKCVFLIACDAEAIKKHLECVYNPQYIHEGDKPFFDADEFLRKFFNTCLRIPDFIDTELQTYTEEMLKETKAVQLDSPEIAYVITCAFRDNPRQIKQFINSLLAHYLLALTREIDTDPLITPKGAITDNVPFLAKLLIVQQKFPDQYDRFLQGETNLGDGKTKAFNDFMSATKRISVKDIRPFHYLKLSEEELQIPGITELEVALMDNNAESVIKVLGTFVADHDKLVNFNKYLLGLMGRYQGRIPVLFNVISSSLIAMRDIPLTLNTQYYDQVAGFLADGQGIGKELSQFEPKLIFDQILERCNLFDRNSILALYFGILNGTQEVKRINKEDYLKSLIIELVDHDVWLDDKKTVIAKTISDKYATYEILSIFKDKPPDDQKEFVSSQSMAKYVSNLGDADVDSLIIKDKVELILDLKNVVDNDILANLLVRLKDLVNIERTKPYRGEKEALLASVYDVLDTFHDKLEQLGAEVLGQLTDALMQGIGSVGNWTQKKIFVLPCFILSDMLEGSRKLNLEPHIKAFITGADAESLRFVIEQVHDNEWLINGHQDAFQQAAMQSQELFNLLYPKAQAGVRTQWLELLITSYPQRAIEFLEQQKYKVDDAKSIVSKILVKAGQSSPADKEGFYRACNAMKCADDESLKDQFASQIKDLLRDNNSGTQQVGINALKKAGFLTATQKRDIARAVIEWLRGLNPNAVYQSNAVDSVVINWQELQETPKKEFLDFVFVKLIKQGSTLDTVQLGFNVLSKITRRPQYADYVSYFDDILSRAKTESNVQIKEKLIEGLLNLKPETKKKQTSDFWQQVSELKPQS
jgi:hypothetical protein